jgi:hypothetical protein
MPRSGRQRRTRNHQVSPSVAHGQVIEESTAHLGPVAMIRPRELLDQDLAQRTGGFNRQDFASPRYELERQPACARGHLDDPVDFVREPFEHAGVEALN